MMAVNMEVTMPMARVMAKPFTGPLPMESRMMATKKVVMLASRDGQQSAIETRLNGRLWRSLG